MSFLELKELKKIYSKDGKSRLVLHIPSFVMEVEEQVVLIGKSGLGKSTLLHLIAGLTNISSGEIHLDGYQLHHLSETKRDLLRAQKIGMIFQKYHLLPNLTAIENVMAGLMLHKNPDKQKAQSLLERLGLRERLHDYPATLSSGQQQRVAIARALIQDPVLILADEPTSGLDKDNAQTVLNLLKEETKRLHAALLIVTHDDFVKNQFAKSIDLKELSQVLS